MTVNQISIFLENKYGKLSEILALLAEERIRIIAATVADTSEYGILRIIVSDPQKAYKILKENNVSANLTDVLAIVTSSCAGSFANTLSYFTKAGISIEYMYCFSIREKAILILRTNNRESAREVIRRQNLEYRSCGRHGRACSAGADSRSREMRRTPAHQQSKQTPYRSPCRLKSCLQT